MGELVLQIKNLSKSFGKNKVLDGINLEVGEGSVLGLMGENGAGKSTMMKCLFGIYAKDEGQFLLCGKPVNFKNPKEALESGVAMVHQELNQCLDRSVADNLYLGRYPKRLGVIDEAKMLKDSINLFASLNMNVNPRTIMRTMSVSQRQMVEIAKAVSYDAKIIVLDEPTSSLTENEVQKLFAIVRDLKKKGVSFVYISHKMDEIFQVCDQVAVLRDGKMIMQKSSFETEMGELITAMVGRSLDKRFPDVDNVPGDYCLEVNNLSTKYAPVLEDISFKVRKGEIFGLYGLVGAGRSELLESLLVLGQYPLEQFPMAENVCTLRIARMPWSMDLRLLPRSASSTECSGRRQSNSTRSSRILKATRREEFFPSERCPRLRNAKSSRCIQNVSPPRSLSLLFLEETSRRS